MKMLLSFLIFLTGMSVAFAAGAAGLIVFGSGVTEVWRTTGESPGFWGYLFMALLNMSLLVGLLLSVLATLSGFCLTILGFVFKSWFRAFAAVALAFVSISIWNYLLECRF